MDNLVYVLLTGCDADVHVEVFVSREQAQQVLYDTVLDWWYDEFIDEPVPEDEDEMVSHYYDVMSEGGYWYNIVEAKIQNISTEPDH